MISVKHQSRPKHKFLSTDDHRTSGEQVVSCGVCGEMDLCGIQYWGLKSSSCQNQPISFGQKSKVIRYCLFRTQVKTLRCAGWKLCLQITWFFTNNVHLLVFDQNHIENLFTFNSVWCSLTSVCSGSYISLTWSLLKISTALTSALSSVWRGSYFSSAQAFVQFGVEICSLFTADISHSLNQSKSCTEL